MDTYNSIRINHFKSMFGTFENDFETSFGNVTDFSNVYSKQQWFVDLNERFLSLLKESLESGYIPIKVVKYFHNPDAYIIEFQNNTSEKSKFYSLHSETVKNNSNHFGFAHFTTYVNFTEIEISNLSQQMNDMVSVTNSVSTSTGIASPMISRNEDNTPYIMKYFSSRDNTIIVNRNDSNEDSLLGMVNTMVEPTEYISLLKLTSLDLNHTSEFSEKSIQDHRSFNVYMDTKLS